MAQSRPCEEVNVSLPSIRVIPQDTSESARLSVVCLHNSCMVVRKHSPDLSLGMFHVGHTQWRIRKRIIPSCGVAEEDGPT